MVIGFCRRCEKLTKIENLMGFKGSFISDLFFQSVGLIAYLIPFTLIITGINNNLPILLKFITLFYIY